MKQSIILIVFVIGVQGLRGQGFITQPCVEEKMQNEYARANEVKTLMEEIVQTGVPGMVAAIYDNLTFWMHATGYAKLEERVALQTCMLQYLGSIPKTYMAVTIMKLHEEGKIQLDSAIKNYLPIDLQHRITNSHQITVRMLLNHTSGIAEYNFNPLYITRLLKNPKKVFTIQEHMSYIYHKPAVFNPGERYLYTNSNYELLAIIADEITGDHAAYMKKEILDPLNLTNTYYRIKAGHTYGDRLVNSYWDRHSDGILENSSELLNSNTASMAGDDGIVCTPADAVNFLKNLFEGKILKHESLEQMKTWAKNKKGKPEYGLGLDLTDFGGEVAIGHSGAGLGTGCQLYYFPEKNVYIFLAINLATVTESPIHKSVAPLLAKLYTVVVGSGSPN